MKNDQIIDAIKAKKLYAYWFKDQVTFSFQPSADKIPVTLDELEKYLKEQSALVAAEGAEVK